MSIPILFRFQDRRSALLAMDTLIELGYSAHVGESGDMPELHLHLERNDLTSALEIVQSHGGSMVDVDKAECASNVYAQAYDLSEIPIPAHTVVDDEEDWEAGETYDHFSADVRL